MIKPALIIKSLLIISIACLFFSAVVSQAHAAYINMNGFETGDTSEIMLIAPSAGFSVQSAVKRTGSYAGQANLSGIESHASLAALNASGAQAAMGRTAATYYTFYFRIGTLPSVDSRIASVVDTTGARVIGLNINNTGALTIIGSTTVAVATLSTGTWYRIEMIAVTNGTSSVRIDGGTPVTVTGMNITQDYFYLGPNGATVTYNMYYDDVAINDSGYTGAGQVNILKPNAAGVQNGWTSAAYTDVDEVPPDGATTQSYNNSNGSAVYDYVNLDSSATGGAGGTIGAAKAVSIVKGSGLGSDWMHLGIYTPTSSLQANNFVLSGSYATQAEIANTDPSTGAAWTPSGLDGAQIYAGSSAASGHTVYVTAMDLMVWNTGNTAPTITGGPTIGYGSYSRTSANNSNWSITFATTDAEQNGGNQLTWYVYTGPNQTGTLVVQSTTTGNGTSYGFTIPYNQTGLVNGSNPLYLSVYDGSLFAGTNPSFTVLRDDVATNTAIKRGSGTGASTGWTASAGSVYAAINEAVADDDSTYVYATGQYNTQSDTYSAISPALPGGAVIDSVSMTTRARKTATGVAQQLQNYAYIGTTYYGAGAWTLADNTSYQNHTDTWTTNPSTGGAWTEAAVNGAQWAFQKMDASANALRVTQAYVTVIYHVGSITTTPSPVVSNTYTVTFTPSDLLSTNSNEISYYICTGTGGTGCLLSVSKGATSGTQLTTGTVTDNGLASGANQRYVRTCDGANNCTDTAFTVTADLRPVVTTSAASGLATNSAILNSTVNPNGASTNVSYLWDTVNNSCALLSYTLAGPTALTGNSNLSGATTQATLPSLQGNKTYYFCVMATNTYGTNYGSVLPLTTLPTPGAYTYIDAGSAVGSGDVSAVSNSGQGTVPLSVAFSASANAIIGGTNYLYFSGGYNAGVDYNNLYRATVSTAGDVGAWSTSGQNQLPVAQQGHSLTTATIGGTTYVYDIGGFNGPYASGAVSNSVYKATIDGSGNIGAWSTASQGQLPAVNNRLATTTAVVGGTTYIYAVGGYNSSAYNTVYKATIDGSGNIGAWSTVSQGQLPVALADLTANTVSIGGTNYIYVLGGSMNLSVWAASTVSTAYRATIDASGNIGTFSTVGQGQLPIPLAGHSTQIASIGGSNFIYVYGGGSSGSPWTNVYKSNIDASGNITGFSSVNQTGLPGNIYQHSSGMAVTTGGTFLYTLGGNVSGAYSGAVYKLSVSNVTDCDDTNASLITGTNYLIDADGDGFPASLTPSSSCATPIPGLPATQDSVTAHTSLTGYPFNGAYFALDTATVGANKYLYGFAGYSWSSGGHQSIVYRAQMDGSYNIGAWSSSGQSALPVTYNATMQVPYISAVINGTKYMYLVGGYVSGSMGLTSVYKSTLDGSGNVGAWSTSGQGQLPIDIAEDTLAIVNVNGNYYIYVFGGYSYTLANWTMNIYRAPIDASGNIGTWSSAGQSTIPLALRYQQVTMPTANVGGTNYVYLIGGYTCPGGSCTTITNAVYRATIDSSGNIGAFSTTNQDQLPSALGAHLPIAVTNGTSTSIYILGGSNMSTNTTAVVRGIINSSGNFKLLGISGQTAMPIALGSMQGAVINAGTTNYIYYNAGSPSTNYIYKASVTQGSYSTTDCDDTNAAPCPPTPGSVTAASSTSVTVSWSAAAGPAPTSYTVTCVSGGTCSNTSRGTQASGFTDTGLTCGVSYTYKVYAVNAAGTSTASNTFSGSTSSCATPPTVTTTAAGGLAGTQADLNSSINPNNDNTSVTYKWWTSANNPGSNCQSGANSNSLSGPINLSGSSALNGSSTKATLPGLTAGNTYYFCATATNGGGTVYGSVLSFVANGGSHPLKDSTPSMITWAALGGQTDYGWEFTPTHDGQITELWSYQGGTETVELWNRDTGSLLASAAIASNGVWTKATITPVNVSAGTVYVISGTTSGNPVLYYSNNIGAGIYGGVKVFKGVGGGALSTVQRASFAMFVGVDITYVTGADSCHTLYPDVDNDGYALSTGGTSQCSGVASVNYVQNTNLNSATTDCYDSNSNVFPNESQGYTYSRGDGSFDYNCSGAIEYNFSYAPFQICNNSYPPPNANAYSGSGCTGFIGSMPNCTSVGAASTQTTCGGSVTYQPSWYSDAACTSMTFWYVIGQQSCR